jgi:hypothetical protein
MSTQGRVMVDFLHLTSRELYWIRVEFGMSDVLSTAEADFLLIYYLMLALSEKKSKFSFWSESILGFERLKMLGIFDRNKLSILKLHQIRTVRYISKIDDHFASIAKKEFSIDAKRVMGANMTCDR